MKPSNSSFVGLIGLFFAQLSFGNPVADRVLCLSNSYASTSIVTLRTDVTERYISANISLQSNGQQIYQNLVKVSPIQSNGIEGWAWAFGTIQGQKAPSVSLLKIDFAARSGSISKTWTTAVGSVPSLNRFGVYYLAPDQTVRHLVADISLDLQTAQSLENIDIKTPSKALNLNTLTLSDGSVLILGQNPDQSVWVYSTKSSKIIDIMTLKMGRLKVLATDNDQVYFVKEETSKPGSAQWEVFAKDYVKNTTRSLTRGTGSLIPELWVAQSQLWSLEDVKVDKTRKITVNNLSTGEKFNTFPESFLTANEAQLKLGGRFLQDVVPASNGYEIVFSLGGIGGIATLNLTNQEWEFHATNGSTYACYGPQLSPEIPWSF